MFRNCQRYPERTCRDLRVRRDRPRKEEGNLFWVLTTWHEQLSFDIAFLRTAVRTHKYVDREHIRRSEQSSSENSTIAAIHHEYYAEEDIHIALTSNIQRT